MPSHLRAVDGVVLQQAGNGTPSLVQRGLEYARGGHSGAAQLFATAAEQIGVPSADQLSGTILQQPAATGGVEDAKLISLFKSSGNEFGMDAAAELRGITFTAFIIHADARTRALETLQQSTSPLVRELIRFRSATDTVLFPSARSSSGQALEAAISTGGLLAETGHLPIGLRNELLTLATAANQGGGSQPLEGALMDLMSLGQRLTWGQLAILVEQVSDTKTLRTLSHFMRQGDDVAVLYSAVCLTGRASGVAEYLTKFSTTGFADLKASLAFGAGGAAELLQRNQRLCNSKTCSAVAGATLLQKPLNAAAGLAARAPWVALACKWLLYLLGGFFLAMAIHFARRVPAIERPLHVRGFHLARESLFALGFLFVVLLLSEPFLSQGSQKGMLPLRFSIATVGGAVATGTNAPKSLFMNETNLIAIGLFFVLQSLIYVSCLVKLAEIRRQQIGPDLKLKLLDNEDHLFDAGLYLGFVGTIVALTLFSLGVIKPSLMAAYSSTSFGIIFVSGFKIFHLRPLRRKLLMTARIPGRGAAESQPEMAYTAQP